MKLLREPLVHFLVLGAALFVIFEITRDPPAATTDAIQVTPGLIEHLATGFERTWRRPPNDEELLQLVQDQVRDEVFYREAIALGLDQDDALIRRRLRQKLESLQEETAELPTPTEQELRAFFDENRARYEQPAKVAFDHVLVDPARHANAGETATSRLAQLQTGEVEDFATLSDPSEQPSHFDLTPEPLLALAFGDVFIDKLAAAPLDEWTGPVESTLGWHLVRVEDRAEAGIPELPEVHEAVARDWRIEQERRLRDATFAELKQRYPVTVTVPGEEGAAIAEALDAPQVE